MLELSVRKHATRSLTDTAWLQLVRISSELPLVRLKIEFASGLGKFLGMQLLPAMIWGRHANAGKHTGGDSASSIGGL